MQLYGIKPASEGEFLQSHGEREEEHHLTQAQSKKSALTDNKGANKLKGCSDLVFKEKETIKRVCNSITVSRKRSCHRQRKEH